MVRISHDTIPTSSKLLILSFKIIFILALLLFVRSLPVVHPLIRVPAPIIINDEIVALKA
jgi:hypothetical protein